MRTSELAWSSPLLDMVFLTKIQGDLTSARPEIEHGSQARRLSSWTAARLRRGAGHVRIELNRLSKRSDGLFGLTQVRQDVSQVVPGLGEMLVQFQRLMIAFGGL